MNPILERSRSAGRPRARRGSSRYRGGGLGEVGAAGPARPARRAPASRARRCRTCCRAGRRRSARRRAGRGAIPTLAPGTGRIARRSWSSCRCTWRSKSSRIAPLLALGLERDPDESLPVQAVVAVERRVRVVEPVDHILKVGFGADRIAVAVGDQVGLGRKARRMAGRAASGRVVHVGGADVDVPLARHLGKPGVADVHDVVHPGLDRLRRLVVGGHGKHAGAQDVVGMVGVDLEVVGPAGERAADVLRVPLALAVVDDLHRVLALQVGLGPAGLGVDRVDPQVGRDVAIEQIELEVNQDRLVVGHLESEPVEARSSLLRGSRGSRRRRPCRRRRGRAAARWPAPGVVGLGLDRGAIGRRNGQVRPGDAHVQRASPFFPVRARLNRAWPSARGRYGR